MQVTRIRSDPVFTSNFQGTGAHYDPLAKLRVVLEHVLTKWGYEECTSSNDDRSESMLRKRKLIALLYLSVPHTLLYSFPTYSSL